MFENVNIHSSVAVYIQIENIVQFAVASGRLKAGDKLPSARELAERVSVNFNTVNKAYRDLEVMGLVYTRRGMGVYINKGIEAKCSETCRRKLVARLHEVVSEAKAAGLTSQEVKALCTASCAIEAEPYGEVPPALFATLKPKK